MPIKKKKSTKTSTKTSLKTSKLAAAGHAHASDTTDSPREKTSGDDMMKAFVEFKKPGTYGALQVLSDLAVSCSEEDVSVIREQSTREGRLDFELFKRVLDDFIEKKYQEDEGKKPDTTRSAIGAKGALDPVAMRRLNTPIPKGKENVRVVVRVRPFMPYEFKKAQELGHTMSPVVYMTEKECQLLNTETGEANHSFKFDHCFWSIPPSQSEHGFDEATQEDVFNYCGVPAVGHAFTGFNTCIFAYGQTGSGKTHSMLGNPGQPGVAPMLIQLLFDRIQELKTSGERTKFQVKVCFLEIYNEKVMDLLMTAPDHSDGEDSDEPKKRRKSSVSSVKRRKSQASMSHESGDTKYRECKVRFSPDKGTYVEGITRLNVSTAAETMSSMQAGMKYRAVASHSLNASSSRSHAIFQICLKQTFILGTTRVSTINIVDLAGSERVKMTHATGSVLTEAKNINQSLSTLRRVIDTLIDNAKHRGKKIPPYRESMLTWVLKDSLGGNSKTVMLAAISPHFSNYEDTLNTLRYALKAKSIILHARVNEEQTAQMVSHLKKELEKLKQQMQSGDYVGDSQEYQQAIDDLKKTEAEAEDFKKRAETEMRVKDEQVREEKKQRFAAVFRNAFFIEKKRMASEDLLAAKDAEIASLRAQIAALEEEMRNLKDRSNERAKEDAKRAQRDGENLERLNEEIGVLKRKEVQMTTDIEQARVQIRRESVRADAYETERDSLKEHMAQLSSSSKEEVDRLRKENERLLSVDQELMQMKMSLSEVHGQKETLESRIRDVESDLKAARRQIDTVLDEKGELRRQVEIQQDGRERAAEEARKNKREFERELHILEVEMDQKDEVLESVQQDMREMRVEVEKAVQEKRQIEDAMAHVRMTHTKHQRNLVFRANELEEKQTKIDELYRELGQTKQELTVTQSHLIQKESQLTMQEFPAFSSVGPSAGSPLTPRGVSDFDLKGYVAGKFFPTGEKRGQDMQRGPGDGSIAPGERVWTGNGYAYGPSPHRVGSGSPYRGTSPRSHRSVSPSVNMSPISHHTASVSPRGPMRAR